MPGAAASTAWACRATRQGRASVGLSTPAALAESPSAAIPPMPRGLARPGLALPRGSRRPPRGRPIASPVTYDSPETRAAPFCLPRQAAGLPGKRDRPRPLSSVHTARSGTQRDRHPQSAACGSGCEPRVPGSGEGTSWLAQGEIEVARAGGIVRAAGAPGPVEGGSGRDCFGRGGRCRAGDGCAVCLACASGLAACLGRSGLAGVRVRPGEWAGVRGVADEQRYGCGLSARRRWHRVQRFVLVRGG